MKTKILKTDSPLETMVDIGRDREGVLVDENGKNIEIHCYNPAPKSKKPFADCVVYTIGSNDGAISVNYPRLKSRASLWR